MGADWTQNLHPGLLVDLHRYRKYDVTKARDLLRVIRNKAHHFRDLDASLQEALGSLPAGYLRYFTQRFPLLLPHTINFVRAVGQGDEAFVDYM